MRKKRDATRLSIAIEGDGISPSSISIRHLSELLGAVTAVIDTVARENGLKPPTVALANVRTGSAAYDMSSFDEQFEPIVGHVYVAAKSRGAGSSPATRTALKRLFSSGRCGAIRLTTHLSGEKRKVVHLAEPIEAELPCIQSTTVLHGRVVLIAETSEGRMSFRLALDDGKRVDVEMAPSETDSVVGLFGKSVRAYVEGSWNGTDFEHWRLESIEPCEAVESILDVFTSIRDELSKDGVSLDAEKWLSEQDQ